MNKNIHVAESQIISISLLDYNEMGGGKWDTHSVHTDMHTHTHTYSKTYQYQYYHTIENKL